MPQKIGRLMDHLSKYDKILQQLETKLNINNTMWDIHVNPVDYAQQLNSLVFVQSLISRQEFFNNGYIFGLSKQRLKRDFEIAWSFKAHDAA